MANSQVLGLYWVQTPRGCSKGDVEGCIDERAIRVPPAGASADGVDVGIPVPVPTRAATRPAAAIRPTSPVRPAAALRPAVALRAAAAVLAAAALSGTAAAPATAQSPPGRRDRRAGQRRPAHRGGTR